MILLHPHIYGHRSDTEMIQHILSYTLLLCTLCCIGALDVLVAYILDPSPYVGYFCNGFLLGVFILENWTLTKDIESMKQPDKRFSDQLNSKDDAIDQLKKDNYILIIDKNRLENQIQYFKETRRITFEDWYKKWQIKQERLKKKPQPVKPSLSWQEMCKPIEEETRHPRSPDQHQINKHHNSLD